MKNFISVCLCVFFPLNLLCQEKIKGQYIVKYKENSIVSKSMPNGVEIKENINESSVLINIGQHCKKSESEIVEEIKNRSYVKYVEPNYIYKKQDLGNVLSLPSDEYYNQQYGHKLIESEKAWDLNKRSKIIVAVIDTGVDYNHADLKENMWINSGEIPSNGIDDDGNGFIDDVYGWDFANNDNDPFDDNGHGTHCAGVIGAKGDNSIGVSGVNWDVKIMPLKFLDARGSGSLNDALKSIEYASKMGALVLSNSWGGGGMSQSMYDMIKKYSDEKGILFVAAAGNSASNNDRKPSYPASYELDSIISVAATDQRDSLAYFSNYGRRSVDLSAPGVGIISTYPGGYASLSGTSMATPFVAGVAASLMSYKCYDRFEPAKEDIMRSVDVKRSLRGKVLSSGRLNFLKSLSL